MVQCILWRMNDDLSLPTYRFSVRLSRYGFSDGICCSLSTIVFLSRFSCSLRYGCFRIWTKFIKTLTICFLDLFFLAMIIHGIGLCDN